MPVDQRQIRAEPSHLFTITDAREFAIQDEISGAKEFIAPDYSFDCIRKRRHQSDCTTLLRSSSLSDVNELWRCFHGVGIKVAIIDTGIALEDGIPHPAFPKGSIIRAVGYQEPGKPTVAFDQDRGRDFDDPKAWQSVEDTNGHGTHCAGIVGARPLQYLENQDTFVAYQPQSGIVANPEGYHAIPASWHPVTNPRTNNDGIDTDPSKLIREKADLKKGEALSSLSVPMAGLSPLAKLLIYKVSRKEDETQVDEGNSPLESIMRAVYDAVENGADIISLSVSAPSASNALFRAIHHALNLGRIVICAAGNSGSLRQRNIGYPARFGGVITVASHDRFGRASPFSSAGGEIDFAGPGEDVWSTWNKGYAKRSGTSMATPWVSGLAALILSKHRIFAKLLKLKNEVFFENETKVRNNEELRELLVTLAAHPGRFEPLDGYGPLWPGDYRSRGLLAH